MPTPRSAAGITRRRPPLAARGRGTVLAVLLLLPAPARVAGAGDVGDGRWPLWVDGGPRFAAVLPATDARGAAIARRTIERHLRDLFGVRPPAEATPAAFEQAAASTFLVAGSRETSPAVAALAAAGLELAAPERLGDEGFELVTREDGGRRSIVAHAATPRGLKHALQELLFFRVLATAAEGKLEGALRVVRRPEVPYRGVYMLPCWSARDSIESWRHVLLFCSDLTINRNWLWLDGFPVAGHTGEYTGTDLADPVKVQGLIDLVHDEDMKVLIGGGWFNWHHEKAVGKDLARGKEYYLQYLQAFRGFHGFYIEPTGEGSEVASWRAESEALRDLARAVLAARPDLELAIAIGKFNSADHLKLLAELDPKHLYWWWCWGDPIAARALDRYPSVLRWHLSQRMSEYHGSIEPPSARDRPLAGVATSYDPGQGFGNPWNGWGKLGTDQRRDFHPHTIPYFAHQYRFRERCWDLEQTDEAFQARLARRLFDDGAPAGLTAAYLALSRAAQESVTGTKPRRVELEAIRALVAPLKKVPHTPRMVDALLRMEEALGELEKRAE